MSGMASFKSGMAGPPVSPEETRVTRLPSHCGSGSPMATAALEATAQCRRKGVPV